MIAPILSHVFYSFSSCVQFVLLADSCSHRKGGLFPHGLYNSVLSSFFGFISENSMWSGLRIHPSKTVSVFQILLSYYPS